MFGSLHLHLSCPRLPKNPKAGFFAISAVLLQMFCDTCPVLGTFFKGMVVQKAQELHFLWQFSGTAQCLTTYSFFSCSILIPLSSLCPGCYLISPSLLLCMPEMYLSPCFRCTFYSCHPCARVALWVTQGSMFAHGLQWIFLLGSQFSPPLCCWPSCLPAMRLSPLGRGGILFPDTHSALYCLAFQSEYRPFF